MMQHTRFFLSTISIVFSSLLPTPVIYASKINQPQSTPLQQAIQNPEYLLKHWITMPVSPKARQKKAMPLSLREAILLALRYNPNIQNAELDRIIQHYQLRLAHNAFELQYALSATGGIEQNRYQDIGSSSTNQFLAAPEMRYKNTFGSQTSLRLDNQVNSNSSYDPVLRFSFTQPLLRGFGRQANEAPLKNAIDNEALNKINLKQTVSDHISAVITAYRALVLSGNNLYHQKRQLKEAQKTFEVNRLKIKAGQLERTVNIQQSYQIESLKLMVEQAQNEFALTSQNLLQAIGLDPDLHLLIPNDLDVQAVSLPTKAQAYKLALKNNAQYQALRVQMRANERTYQVAKNEQLWQLDVGATIQSGNVNDPTLAGNLKGIYNGQNTSQSAQLTLTIPIQDVNRKHQLIAAKVQLEKDKLNYLAFTRHLKTTVNNMIANAESLLRRYELAKKQVELASESYGIEKKKLSVGISSALDVSNTQNQLIQAQAGLIAAKVAYLNQITELERFLGLTLDKWHIYLRYGT